MEKVYEIVKPTSQSIFDTLKSRKRTVIVHTKGTGLNKKHFGLDVELPAVFPNDETFSNFDLLVEHLKKYGDDKPLAVLQSGIAQELINLWAVSKPRPERKKEGIPAELIESDSYVTAARRRVRNYLPSVAKRPDGTNGKKIDQARYNDCMKALSTGLQAGIKEESLIAMFSAVYGPEIVAQCLKAINTLTDTTDDTNEQETENNEQETENTAD